MQEFLPVYPPEVREERADVAREMGRAQALCGVARSISFSERTRCQIRRDRMAEYLYGALQLEENPCTLQQVRALLRTEGAHAEEEREGYAVYRVLRFLLEHARAEYGDAVTLPLVLEAYRILMSGVYAEAVPVAQPCAQSTEALCTLLDYIQGAEAAALSPVTRAALLHGYFLALSPLPWGNGHIARALETYLLHCNGYADVGYYMLAGAYARDIPAYRAALQALRAGDPGDFVRLTWRALADELENGLHAILQSYDSMLYRDYAQELLRFGRVSERACSLAELLWMLGPVSEKSVIKRKYPLIAGLYEKVQSERTVRRDLDKLVDCNLVRIDDGMVAANVQGLRAFGDALRKAADSD